MQTAGRVTIAKRNIVVNCPILYTAQGAKAGSTEATGKLPVTVGWYNGQQVYYVSPDASDAGAGGAYANLSVMLAGAANTGAVDDLYAVTNFKQGNIIPSAPVPAGPGNSHQDYTPLWQVSLVTWNAGVTPHTLMSEADVRAVLADGVATMVKTGIVVTCPEVHSPVGGILPGVVITTSK